jgi:hypothetical protein
VCADPAVAGIELALICDAPKVRANAP